MGFFSYNRGMEILYAVPDDHVIERKSSISQHTDKLGLWKKGEFIPIEFDQLDYIDCKKIASHKAVISFGDDIGFNYPTGTCRVIDNNYLLFDQKEAVLKALPSWFGEGFYEAFVDKFTMINFSSCSLGLDNSRPLTVGLDYVKCKTVLPPVE